MNARLRHVSGVVNTVARETLPDSVELPSSYHAVPAPEAAAANAKTSAASSIATILETQYGLSLKHTHCPFISVIPCSNRLCVLHVERRRGAEYYTWLAYAIPT